MKVTNLQHTVIALLFLYQYFCLMIPAARLGLSKCNKLNFKSLIRWNHQNMCAVQPSDGEILERVRRFIPPLIYDQHKGQSGRIGVIGGCEEYTGAPYFAAISALKLGADLSHVFCTKSAATAIKSYSPELIVHPILDGENAREQMRQWIPRLHAVVIGPGLGTDQQILKTVEGIVDDLKLKEKPIVFDADGLFIIARNIELVRGYKNTIITPNAIEFQRLVKALGLSTTGEQDGSDLTAAMSEALGGVTVTRKQRRDIISDSKSVLQVKASGSPRRCGGQGDLLSGAAAVFFHWALTHESKYEVESTDIGPGVLSAYAACHLSRLCAESAFSKMGRSTTTTDLINEIHGVFDKNFDTS